VFSFHTFNRKVKKKTNTTYSEERTQQADTLQHNFTTIVEPQHTICSRHKVKMEFVILVINTLIAILIIIVIVILI
jgi:hypothetical protein